MYNTSMQNIKFSLLIFLVIFIVSCSGKPTVKPEGPFNPEKSLAKANEQIDKKDYEDARTTLLEIKNRDLSKNFAPLAQLKIADTYVKEGEPELAVVEYQRFLEVYPDHKYAMYAQYQIAMVHFSQIEGPERGYGGAAKAIEEFERLKKMFPRNPYKEIIDIRIEKCKNIIADYEFLVGEFYYKKESYNSAIARFEGLMKKYPHYKREADVLFYSGMSYKKLGQREKAVEYLNRLIEKYPNYKTLKAAKKELATIK